MSTIFVVDILNPKPGRTDSILQAYLRDYVPKAQKRGMVLKHRWMDPPVLLTSPQTNRLTFVWEVEGTEGWWKMRMGGLIDPSISEFWDRMEPLIASRERSFPAEIDTHV